MLPLNIFGFDIPDWGVAIGVLCLFLVASWLARTVLARAIDKGIPERRIGRHIGRWAAFLLAVVGVLYALSIAGVKVGPAVGALGIGGVAIAIASQEILHNLIAGVIIQARRPFVVNDQITAMDIDGTVIDIDLRTVRLRTFDGLDALLPNAAVLAAPIINHTRTPSRRTRLPVGVRYDTDLAAARKLLLETVRQVPGVDAEPEPAVWVKEFADSSISLEIMFWHESDVMTVWKVRSAVAIAVKSALDEAGIEIPFPQRTVWFSNSDLAANMEGARPQAGSG